MTLQIRYSPNPRDYPQLEMNGLREAFLIETLFMPGRLELVYADGDPAIICSSVPSDC